MTRQHEEFEKFKQKLFNDTVLTKPVFNTCFDLAWELGHACGYHEVENYFRDLEELFERTYQEGYDTARYFYS